MTRPVVSLFEPAAIQRVLASSLTFRISRVCYDSNETRAPIANPSNSAQLGGTQILISPYAYSNVCIRRGTDTHTHRRARPVYISLDCA